MLEKILTEFHAIIFAIRQQRRQALLPNGSGDYLPVGETPGMRTALLREIRESKKITLEQLSGDVDLSVSQLSRFESGDRFPRVHELERIAERLGADPWIFLDRQPGIAPAPPAPEHPQLRRAIIEVCGHLLDSICDTLARREMLANSNYRRAIARLLVAAATAPLDPDAILADPQAARQQALVLFHALAHQEFEQ